MSRGYFVWWGGCPISGFRRETKRRFYINMNYLITGPTGEIVAAANDKDEDVLVAEFDLDKIKSKRHAWGVFRDRRPELYKVLLTLDGINPIL